MHGMLDLVLACLHHLLIFGLFGLLLSEFLLLKPGLDAAALARVSRIDLMYGVAAYELALFLLLPLFAAAMARGFGEF
jgi:putative membrane protein